jgi:Transferrin
LTNATCYQVQATCDDESIYWDYPGALRCLMEDAGDVAFFKV